MQREYDFGRLIAACRSRGLVAHLRRWALPRKALIDAAPEPGGHEPYGRRTLFRDGSGEVLLIGWRDGMSCSPHDHGPAGGIVYLLRGRFVERSWSFSEGSLGVTTVRRFEAPASLRVTAGDIHDMAATDGGVSLHVYVPSITAMTVFDRERRETLVLDDDCGAWVPEEPKLIRARTAWPVAAPMPSGPDASARLPATRAR